MKQKKSCFLKYSSFHRIYAIYIGKEMSRTEIVTAAMEQRYAIISYIEKNLVRFKT